MEYRVSLFTAPGKKVRVGFLIFFPGIRGISKGFQRDSLWSEKEGEDSGGVAVGPEFLPESPRGPGVHPWRRRERSVYFGT